LGTISELKTQNNEHSLGIIFELTHAIKNTQNKSCKLAIYGAMYSANIIYTKVIYVTKAQPNTIPAAETIHM